MELAHEGNAEDINDGTSLRNIPDPSVQTLFQDDSIDESSGTTPSTKVIFDNVFSTISYTIICSVIGCISRVGLSTLTSSIDVDAYLLPNFLGTAIIVFLIHHKAVVHGHHLPLYTGIATGFCGSLTTFSAWQQNAADYKAQNTESVGELITLWFSIQGIGFAIAMMGYDFGDQLTILSPRKPQDESLDQRPTLNVQLSVSKFDKRDWLALLLASICIILVSVWCVLSPSALSFSAAWAPVGAVSRWCLSFANKKRVHFPVGTLAANVIGSILLASTGLVLTQTADMSRVHCDAMKGFVNGFCGSLTTVSTWVCELRSLNYRNAYRYGLVSIFLTQLFMIPLNSISGVDLNSCSAA